MKRSSRLAFLLFLLASCQYSEDRYARRVIKPSEIVGTWRATDFSLSCLARIPNEGRLTKNENELTLRADASCAAKGYLNPDSDPPLRLGFTNRYQVLDEGCRWLLRTQWRQELTIADGHQSARFFFDDSEDALILWQYVGDPDAWQYVEFRRE